MRWRGPQGCGFVLLYGETELVGLECGKQDGAGAHRPRAMQRVKAVEVGKRRGAEDAAFLRKPMLRRAEARVAEQGAIGVHDTLGRRGSARGVEQEEWVGRPGLRETIR